MSQLGNYDMSFPGLSVSGGSSTGSSSGTSSGSSSGQGTSQQSTQIVPGMLGVYQQLLGANENNYGNMLNAYQNQLGANKQTQAGINAGYGALGTGVMNTLGLDTNGQPNGSWGVAAPAAQAIGNTYNQQVATNQQQMVNSGLGNSTVGANLNNQAAQAAALSYGQLGSQLAGQAAGYQAQIGQAGLGAQMQGMQTNTGLTQGALNPLATQFSNTAGTLTGGFGQSQYTNNSSQQSKQGSQQNSNQGQGGSSGAGGGGPELPTGAPGGAAGGGSGSGGGGGGYGADGSNYLAPISAGSGSTYGNVNSGLNSIGGAYGPTGGNNANLGQPGNPYTGELESGDPYQQGGESGNFDPSNSGSLQEQYGLSSDEADQLAGLNQQVMEGGYTPYAVDINGKMYKKSGANGDGPYEPA